jgi:hypothetical protein
MKKHRLAYAVFITLLVISLAQSLWLVFGPTDTLQPDQADASRDVLILAVVQVCTLLLLAVTFLGGAAALPMTADWALNIPKKQYWLAADRREQTLDYAVRWLLWFGTLNLLLIMMVFRAAHASEMGEAVSMDIWLIFAAYTAFTIFFVLQMNSRFGSPPHSESAET